MGAHDYFYFVKYDPDINSALRDLREQEFRAGRLGASVLILGFCFHGWLIFLVALAVVTLVDFVMDFHFHRLEMIEQK